MSDRELPFTKVVEVVGDDGSTTWQKVKNFRSMEDFKKIPDDFESVDGKKVDISQSLLDILAKIPEVVPADFKDEAVKVAEWITVLDRGGREVLNNSETREWLGEVFGGSGLMTMEDTQGLETGWAPLSSEEKTPWWLKQTTAGKFAEEVYQYENLGENEEEEMKNLYLEWGRRNGFEERYNHNWGLFFELRNIYDRANEADGFKIYFGGGGH